MLPETLIRKYLTTPALYAFAFCLLPVPFACFLLACCLFAAKATSSRVKRPRYESSPHANLLASLLNIPTGHNIRMACCLLLGMTGASDAWFDVKKTGYVTPHFE